MKKLLFGLSLTLGLLLAAGENNSTSKSEKLNITVRAGVATDVSFDPGFGIGINYLLPNSVGGNPVEIGVMYVTAHSEWDGGTYQETTDTDILAVMYNILNGYNNKDSLYYIYGVGFASVSIFWEETSTVFPAYYDSVDATGFANILNVGLGKKFESGLDLRFELPVLVFYSAGITAPTVMVTAGMSF